jgi:hypothetical protein
MRQFGRDGRMPTRLVWQVTLGAVFVAITIFDVHHNLPKRSAEALLPAARSPSPEATKNARFVSELSPDGRLKAAGSPEAIGIAAAQAKGLFRETRWDEFVATAERLNSAGEWTVRIEPKSGERDDIMWLTVEGNHVTRFGFHRRDKLKGYTGKSKKGASPGFCR